ncbi:(2Fe-2S)-binding protein [Oceanobacillus oncorhynchi subsp. incaldanensis]|uniref:(2Fe-2S)-binding protein n=1 Tax=Oceanobacillus oncorhynchi TaxID=545501 RepID=UPI001AFE976F|nr:(2Fe-2S)-binding protein [Oceanobacillus oncorhynchi]GIO19553.1 (2Fe-2S)-binding protein [Oceanobacillus oncorhynchi subsp. incaldanensis]
MVEIVQDQRAKVSLTINGRVVGKYVEPRKLLSDFIREDLALTGTHIGCEHGVCGSCTILFNGSAVRSCLMFTVQADGSEIKTIEGLFENGKMSSLQEAFIESHGLQCGFCTPGILMSAYEILQSDTRPSKKEIKEILSGHLCRCTGYKGIIEAIEKALDRKSKE